MSAFEEAEKSSVRKNSLRENDTGDKSYSETVESFIIEKFGNCKLSPKVNEATAEAFHF